MSERLEPVYRVNFSLETEAGTPASGHVTSLIINRPDSANAFNGDILVALTEQIEAVRRDADCRVLLIQGAGKHFSAGADLGWMQAAARMGVAENKAEAQKLIQMFEALTTLHIPTISIVRGAAYGGAVGLVACTDFAIAANTAKFCLSEIKVGLLPAVILPYLSRKIPQGDLRRLTLAARVFDGLAAKECHLVQCTTPIESLNTLVIEEVNQLLLGSPEAQTRYKNLQTDLLENGHSQGQHTVEAIAAARASSSGQAGLQAFFDKKPAPWTCRIPTSTHILAP